MSYKDPDRQRQYQREYCSKRRLKWIEENGPCKCGSKERLEVDHIDPKTKVTHNVWSWTKSKRDEELAKCQVLCYDCHKEKTKQSQRKPPPPHGTLRRYKSNTYPCRCDSCKDINAKYEHKRRLGV